jgi:hypothetical protein
VAGRKKAPILLTNTDSIPPEMSQALRDMGINQAIILGLQGAVSDSVQTTLSNTQSVDCTGTPVVNGSGNPVNIGVQRIGGTDRFATARLVSESQGLSPGGTLTPDGAAVATPATAVNTAILASGENFPDALAAGPMAYGGTNATNGDKLGFPLLLTNTASLTSSAAQGLSDLGIKQVIIPGGTAAVSAATEASVTAMGIHVKRMAGADRTDTAGQVADFETITPAVGPPASMGLGYNLNSIGLSRGDDFADALAGGPREGMARVPILLTGDPNNLGTFTAQYLKENGPVNQPGGITTLDVFGGVAAISAAVVTAAQSSIAGN